MSRRDVADEGTGCLDEALRFDFWLWAALWCFTLVLTLAQRELPRTHNER